MQTQQAETYPPARDFLLQQVAKIGSLLNSQIPGEEAARRLSSESYEALYEAGVFKMKLPRVLGGFEADLVTQFEVLEALAMHSPAAAWCSMVGATSLAMPGAFLSDAGVKKMFAQGNTPRGAIVIMPTGQASPVAGGYTLSGRWAFASGVHHAQWVSAHVMVKANSEAQPELYMFCFPASEITLHDNWNVLGLRGTGSCDISVENLFVPEECTWQVGVQAPQRGGGLYHLGIPAFVAYEHAAFAIGVGRLALKTFIDMAQKKKRGYGPDASSLGDRHTIQAFIGRSDLKLRGARQLAMALNRQAMDSIETSSAIDNRLAIELRAIATYCTEVSAEVINEALRHSGAGAIYDESPMQRYLRDINVAAQHLMVSNLSYELLGRSHLGQADVPPMG